MLDDFPAKQQRLPFFFRGLALCHNSHIGFQLLDIVGSLCEQPSYHALYAQSADLFAIPEHQAQILFLREYFNRAVGEVGRNNYFAEYVRDYLGEIRFHSSVYGDYSAERGLSVGFKRLLPSLHEIVARSDSARVCMF